MSVRQALVSAAKHTRLETLWKILQCKFAVTVPERSEAPVLETLASQYADSGLVLIASGFDWGQPYSCDQWASQFNLTYPIIDDAQYKLYDAFGTGYVPHNVVIDHNMVVRHSDAGFSLSGITDLITTILAEIKAEGS